MQAFTTATRMVQLFDEDRARSAAESERAGSALRVHAWLQRHPFSTSAQLVAATGPERAGGALGEVARWRGVRVSTRRVLLSIRTAAAVGVERRVG